MIVCSLVVDSQLLGCVRVVKDNHLSISDDRNPPNLHRVEPADMNAREHPIGIRQGDKDHVFCVGLQVRLTAGDEIGGITVEPVSEHRYVMRREIPQRVNVLANRPETSSLKVHVPDLAQQALIDISLDGLYRGVEEEGMADHERPVHGLGKADDCLRVLNGRGDWLFDKHVHTGLEALFSYLTVS